MNAWDISLFNTSFSLVDKIGSEHVMNGSVLIGRGIRSRDKADVIPFVGGKLITWYIRCAKPVKSAQYINTAVYANSIFKKSVSLSVY